MTHEVAADPQTLTESLGVHIAPEALRLALTHRSYSYENDGIPTNERLEFLGDSVLGYSVTDYLYARFPEHSEGDLAKLRAALVSTRALARIGRSLDIGPHIMLGAGELRTGGRDKDSILADTMEALIGAAYLSTSLDTAREFVLRHVVPLLSDRQAMNAGRDWKTTVQEIAAARDLGDIRYLIEDSGPDHDKTFAATLTVGGSRYRTGVGKSKKDAEREAARLSVEELAPSQASDPEAASRPGGEPAGA
ncbi:MAG: ribonuclease III [Nesterenkonia sp.]|uniref:ribonuclease III n=1 Tax=Nesterenkonia marinintestina TaxID=2979865 RepID=UPI0021BEC6D4|nr:ribonuclease III [Nesterenkonia sp. GX14115]MDO5492330.1 ribonuclease III [Nesterenkonia sp.]